jgi:ABC-2 type transport system permease protein
MRAALRYERVRVLTVRSTKICLVLVVLMVLGLAYLTGQAGSEGQVLWWDAFVQPLFLAAILASVVAAQNLGQEYRFGLIRITLTAFPRRGQILSAKGVFVVLAALAFMTLSYAASWVALALQGKPTPTGTGGLEADSLLLVRGAVLMALWCLSAWAIAGITRQTSLGIIIPVVAGLIVEPILGAVLGDRAEWLVKILPFSSAGRWAESGAIDGGIGDSLPVGWEALGIFGLWVLVLVVIEAVLFTRRDA